MNPVQVLLIAVGLAADAFAVSVAEGIALHKVTGRHTLRLAVHFGAFQALMPVLGWSAGTCLRGVIGGFDHWVAFGLLIFIGGKMLLDTLTGPETRPPREPTRGARLIGLSLATSMDALAVGVSLAMLNVKVWGPAAAIGVVTGVLCATGVQLGDRVGSRIGKWAELAGGTILCLIGVKILASHLW